MAGRKRHFAEEIVRRLRGADKLAAEGKTGERDWLHDQVTITRPDWPVRS